MDKQCHFSGARSNHNSRSLNEITQIKHLVEKVDLFLTKVIHTQEQLDPPVAIFDMRKRDLAHGTRGTDTSCQGNFHFGSRLAFRGSLLGGFEGCDSLGARMRPFGPGGK